MVRNPPREPVRTCVACRQEAGKRTLTRVVRDPAGVATIDRTGRATGRGAYLHREPECVEIARRRKALERALKAVVSPDFWAEIESSPHRGEERRGA